MSAALAATGLLPAPELQLIIVGERTGALGAACERVAAALGERCKRRLERWLAVLPPIMILLIGAAIAYVATTILRPLHHLTKGLII